MNNLKSIFQIGTFCASALFLIFSIGGKYANPGANLPWINTVSVLSTCFFVAWLSIKFIPIEKCKDNIPLVVAMIALVFLFIGCGIFVTSFLSDTLGESLQEIGPAGVFDEFVSHSKSLLTGLDKVKDAAKNGEPEQLSAAGQHFHWIVATIFFLLICLILACSSIPTWIIIGTKKTFWTIVGITLVLSMAWLVLAVGNFSFYGQISQWISGNGNLAGAAGLLVLMMISIVVFLRSKSATAG